MKQIFPAWFEKQLGKQFFWKLNIRNSFEFKEIPFEFESSNFFENSY